MLKNKQETLKSFVRALPTDRLYDLFDWVVEEMNRRKEQESDKPSFILLKPGQIVKPDGKIINGGGK